MGSGRHKLSENIWFVWSIMSYNGDIDGCHACPRTDTHTECEDRARILETEFAKQIYKPNQVHRLRDPVQCTPFEENLLITRDVLAVKIRFCECRVREKNKNSCILFIFALKQFYLLLCISQLYL